MTEIVMLGAARNTESSNASTKLFATSQVNANTTGKPRSRWPTTVVDSIWPTPILKAWPISGPKSLNLSYSDRPQVIQWTRSACNLAVQLETDVKVHTKRLFNHHAPHVLATLPGLVQLLPFWD